MASSIISVDSRSNPTPTVIKQIGTFTLDAQGVGDENGYVWRYNGDVQRDLTTRIIKAKKEIYNNCTQQDDIKYECQICYKTDVSFNLISITDCAHSFCFECLIEALFYKNFCPTCRKIINIKNFKSVYREEIKLYEEPILDGDFAIIKSEKDIDALYKLKIKDYYKIALVNFTECKNKQPFDIIKKEYPKLYKYLKYITQFDAHCKLMIL